MKRVRPMLMLLASLALACWGGALAYADNASGASSGNAEAVADGNTASTWRDWGLENSTENVGRIWTDKTVQAGDITLTGAGGEKTIAKGDSTFLTALSAISSTSNLKSTATTPLDIVLVLDASGSMDSPMGSTDYTKRIVALQEAANSFIDNVAAQNASISDTAKQHHVSIVKFAGNKTNEVGNQTYYGWNNERQYTSNYSQVMKTMSACTDDSKASFKSTIDGIVPAGATRADYGMELAQGQTSGRDDAKKVVIFFTDGTPTSWDQFDSGVASNAVGTAKSMKDSGASIYTIGIFDGANPSASVNSRGTSTENKFMQAVSSNYPSATYNGARWNFGTRAESAEYYKSATNADELKKVFDDISQEIVQGAGYPTDTKEGFEAYSGFITFTDQLGDYMKVDGFTSIVFANRVFENPTKTTNGLVDTYTFTGEAGNALYPKGNLNAIDITVTRSDDLQTGDKVEVKIPAALIPLRNFTVNADGTGSVDLTFPIRAFYGSSLKDGVAEALASPDSALAAYVASNSADGKVSFFANKWNGGVDGDTIADFTPSKGNSYYYITEDTPIYQDEACTQRAAAPLEKDKTYYYQRTWYDLEGRNAVQKTKAVSFDSGVVENIDGYISSDAGKAYFKAGTPRMTYLNELNTKKGEDNSHLSANNTNTAETFINPKWAGTVVNVHLGNNGKLSVAEPGALAVSKTLQVPEGYNVGDFADESFEFTIAVPDAKGTTLKAQVKNAAGEDVGGAFDIAFDENGNATHSLKNGETLYVYGLTAGTEYTVSESAKAGFTQTAPVDETGAATAATGAIKAGETSHADFTNTYAASGMLNGEAALAGTKAISGRPWLSGDSFAFLLKGANASAEASMPEGSVDGVAKVEVKQSEGTTSPCGFNFGNITYTQPGTYVYEIHESADDSAIQPGMSASNALYRITVTVTDEHHDGVLTVTSAMKKIKDDKGEAVADDAQQVEAASFTNTYDTQTVSWAPMGKKAYSDSTGAHPLKAGMFNFALCAKDGTPMPKGTSAETVECAIDGETWHGVISSAEESGDIAFPQAEYEWLDAHKTFEYKIVEVVKDSTGKWVAVKDALADSSYARDGMTYDPSVWTVQVTPQENTGDVLVLDVKYLKDGAEQQGAAFAFANSYSPAPATTTINGTKTLIGRDMADGETFGFTLSAADKATQDAVAAGAVTIPANTATVSGGKNGKAEGFTFGNVTFTKPGTYTFNVSETHWDGSALPDDGTEGLTFDRTAKTVTVTVADDQSGSLKAEVAYPEGGLAFANQYASSATFAGIQVSKVLEGRVMAAGEFGFTVEGADDASKALLADDDKSFSNENPRAAGEPDVMTKLAGHTFTLADVGKTYEFTVKEVIPEGAVQDEATGLWLVENSGLYYDGATHTVKISVTDNGKGQLAAATTVDGVVGNLVSFVNKYRAGDAGFDTANAQLKKVLEGRDWLDSDSFTFTLKALTDGAPLPDGATGGVATTTVTRANAENFGFGTITFTSGMLDAGSHSKTFEYEVAETKGAIADIDYAANKATIKVTVVDNGEGKLSVLATTENGTFVNRYDASVSYTAHGGLKVAKTLNGRDMADGQFKIAVTPSNSESAQALGLSEGANVFAMPAAADGQQVVKQVLEGRDVEFTQKEIGKTYTYTVAEQQDGKAGYSYDQTTYTVSIAVTVSADGKLTVTTSVTGGASAGTYVYTSDSSQTDGVTLAFANAYKATGAVSLSGTKALTGRSLNAGEFNFAVKYAAAGGDLLSAKNAANGSIDFGSLSYSTETLAQLVEEGKAVKGQDGTWTVNYVAYEKTDGLAASGVTAQTQPISFTVTVADNGDGTLTATPNVGKGLKFENTYAADSASVQLAGVKVLKHEEGLVPGDITGKFTFTVTGEKGAPLPERTTATNDANGAIDFGTITFTLDDLNKALGTNGAVTQSTAEEPTANAAAQGSAAAVEPSKSGGAQSAEAENAQATEGAGGGAVASSVESGQTTADNADAAEQKAIATDGESAGTVAATTQTVKAAPSATAAANEPVAASAPAAGKAAAKVKESASSSQVGTPTAQAGTPRSHVFTYKITESGSVAGVTNDIAMKTVSFKVTDDGNGKLTVTRVEPAGESTSAFTFTNTYSVQPKDSSVTDQIAVTKQLTGRDLKADEFHFELLEGTDVVATGANDAAGNVVLSKITYNAPGTHTYTLHEVGGGTQQAGVTYDGAAFSVITTVTDKGDGTLSVAHVLSNGETAATFNNTYSPAATSATLGAAKVLKGKSLEAGEFSFVLKGEDGSEATTKNDANGNVTFGALEFSKADTYHYTIAEEKGSEAGVTYDETTYPVTVTVKDDGQGNLTAEVSYEQGEVPVFVNSYEEPESPLSFITGGGTNGGSHSGTTSGAAGAAVKTGDGTLALAAVIAAVAALAIGIGALTFGRGRKHK